jgi:hypothetical protein
MLLEQHRNIPPAAQHTTAVDGKQGILNPYYYLVTATN